MTKGNQSLLKKFEETLSKGAMIWYHNLPEHSIDSFAMLADAFVKAHAGAIKVETRKSDLFNVKQRDDETLREFVARFQMERMDLLPVTDDWAVQAFTQGLNSRSSITSMELKQNSIEYPRSPGSMYNRYQSKIRIEDNKILKAASVSWHFGKESDRSRRVIDRDSRLSYDRYQPYPLDRRGNRRNSESGKNDRRNDRRNDRGQNSRDLVNRNVVDRAPGNRETPRLSEYNFCVDVAAIAATDRPEEPQQVIHMIMGGTDIPIGPVMKRTKISITREKRIRNDDPDGPITFNDEDMEGIAQPYNDALVISVLVNKFRIKRVLIDPGSSANIIRWRVIEQLGLLDQIVPAIRVLNGFNMACETTNGEITLLISMAGTTQQIKFYVIEGDMGYNELLGRPWIHLVRAVPSTMHQVLKFSTPEGIKIVRGFASRKRNVRG
ncbi:uncharacterized protein LOC132034700 [Lycium ferocissimum]|uniref:uncharacterized protein LOC132034700 n=1 Tax=Lycium ferocissimum TaxID=112874 RepID=UPI002815F819|nr:uncharacterized protein LOC132034700 [Lycium ferocissimum]